MLEKWPDHHNLILLKDAKYRKCFRSARWTTKTNPNLCFVTSDITGKQLPSNRQILGGISAQSVILVTVSVQIPLIRKAEVPGLNFTKDNCDSFRRVVAMIIEIITPAVRNYKQFTIIFHQTAIKSIP